MMQICYTASLSSFVDRYNSSSTPSTIQFSLHISQRNPVAAMWNCLLFTSMPVYDITHTPIIIVDSISRHYTSIHHCIIYALLMMMEQTKPCIVDSTQKTTKLHGLLCTCRMQQDEVVWVSIYEQHPPKAFLFTTVWIGDIHSQNG